MTGRYIDRDRKTIFGRATTKLCQVLKRLLMASFGQASGCCPGRLPLLPITAASRFRVHSAVAVRTQLFCSELLRDWQPRGWLQVGADAER
jgi:hypothetical protein